MIGVKRTARRPGELITAVTVPVLDGWQGYAKVGVRNAMVIAICGACLAVDTPGRSVRLALGSVAPTIVRAPEAEAFAASAVDWSTATVDDDAVTRFGRSPPPRRVRSTTTAPARPTAGTRSRSSPGACCDERFPDDERASLRASEQSARSFAHWCLRRFGEVALSRDPRVRQ